MEGVGLPDPTDMKRGHVKGAVQLDTDEMFDQELMSMYKVFLEKEKIQKGKAYIDICLSAFETIRVVVVSNVRIVALLQQRQTQQRENWTTRTLNKVPFYRANWKECSNERTNGWTTAISGRIVSLVGPCLVQSWPVDFEVFLSNSSVSGNWCGP